MSRESYSVAEVEEMLRGGEFRPSNDLQVRIRSTLREPPAVSPVPRFAWIAGLTVLVSALVLTGIVIALSPREKAASIIYGVAAVYEAGLVQPIDESKQIGDISLTMDWAYADWNQILVGYTAQSRPDESAHVSVEIVSARLVDGTAPDGGFTAGFGEMGADSSVATFDMPETVRDRQTIDVQLVLSAAYEKYQTPPGTDPEEEAQNPSPSGDPSVQVEPFTVITAGGGEAAFEFSIPVTPGRVIEVGQTVEAKGYAVTLEQVVLAPSMTTARLCFEVPDPVRFRQWSSFVTLKTGIKGYSGAGEDYQVGDTYSCQRVEIGDSVPLDRDRYILRVDELAGFEFHPGDIVTTDMLPEEQWRVKGPWVFTLEVKP